MHTQAGASFAYSAVICASEWQARAAGPEVVHRHGLMRAKMRLAGAEHADSTGSLPPCLVGHLAAQICLVMGQPD